MNEPMYCSQQIKIPPELPDIMKQFTKAAIRTQPPDVLKWSAGYFQALANGETLPVKERLETPVATQKTDTGLTPGLVSVLHRQLGTRQEVTYNDLFEKWQALCLPTERLEELLRVGSFDENIEWLKFLSLACSSLAGNLTQTMRVVCEILTHDPEGGAARISFEVFKDLYQYLARVDGNITQSQIDSVFEYLQYHVDKQDGMVHPRNFMNEECPKLDGGFA